MGAGNSDDTTAPPLADLFAILASQRRRYILQCLIDHGPRVSLPDLADEVSVRTYDCPITAISEEDVLAVYISLYHRHIPTLAQAGVVQYDQERDLVTLVADVDHALQPLLDEFPEREPDA